MGFQADIKAVVRGVTRRSIPRGSMLFIEDHYGVFDHLEEYVPRNDTYSVKVHVDQPDDEIDIVEVPIESGQVLPCIIPTPRKRVLRRESERQEAITVFGEALIVMAENHARECVNRCLSVFEKRKPSGWVTTSRSTPVPRLSWERQRKSSWGGKGHISLAMRHVFTGRSCEDPMGGSVRFYEYSHIAADPVIGHIYSDRWEVHVAALAAHEVAHHLQRAGHIRSGPDMRTAHGEGWQMVYSILRKNCVNTLEMWSE